MFSDRYSCCRGVANMHTSLKHSLSLLQELRLKLDLLTRTSPIFLPSDHLKPLSGVLLERHSYTEVERVLNHALTLLPLSHISM